MNTKPAASRRSVRLTPLAPDMVDLVRQTYALWNEGGPAAMLRESWHPNLTWHDPPDSHDSSVHHGAAAVERHLNARHEALGRAVVKVENAWWVREGEVFLAELALHSEGQLSGIELDVRLFHLVRISEGRVIETREYLRREQALEAIARR
jgi:ketosteroid isomerase-like protein